MGSGAEDTAALVPSQPATVHLAHSLHSSTADFTGVARNINQPVDFQLIHSMLVTVTFYWLKAALSHWLLGQCGQASLGPNFSGALLLPRGGKALKYIKQFQNDTTPLSSNTTMHKGWFTKHNS